MGIVLLDRLVLQTALSKVMKGVINNNILFLTHLIRLKLKDGKFSLLATDKLNYIKVELDNIDGEDFEVVVVADKFNRLIQKTTAKAVKLSIYNNYLEVNIGTGNYKFEYPTEPDGSSIKYPEIPEIIGDKEVIQLSNVKSVFESNKAGIATTFDVIYLTGYYCGDTSMTSNNTIIASNNSKIFKKPFLASKELFVLLTTMSQENISVIRNKDKILFKTEDVTIYSVELQGASLFPYSKLSTFIESKFKNNCKISKQAILNVLDRISAFLNSEDKNLIYLTFTEKGLMIQSKKITGSEIVAYADEHKYFPFSCCVDLTMFKSIISPQKVEFIELYYGNDISLKSVNKEIGVSYLLAIFDEESTQQVENVSEKIDNNVNYEKYEEYSDYEDDVPY